MKKHPFTAMMASIFILIFSPLHAKSEYKIERIGPPISHPWGMSQLSETSWLVTSRSGALYQIDTRKHTHQQIQNIPQIFHKNQGGLLDVAVRGSDIYLCYSRPLKNEMAATALYTARLEGARLQDGRNLFTSNQISRSGRHFGCRIVLADNFIYLSLGDRGARDAAQDSSIYAGAVIRLHVDGKLAPAGLTGGLAGSFTKGHRNPQGMAIYPQTGEMWVHEHGPKGGDEINILQEGANYGWPILSYGREYFGGQIGDGQTQAPDFADPVWVWVPSIAPSGMAFYTGDMFPEFKGDLLVGSLKFRSLYHIRLEGGRPVSEQALLKREIGRVRDVAMAADGSILLLSDEENGGLYRLSR